MTERPEACHAIIRAAEELGLEYRHDINNLPRGAGDSIGIIAVATRSGEGPFTVGHRTLSTFGDRTQRTHDRPPPRHPQDGNATPSRPRTRVPASSNSMLGCRPTTPQDYPEWSGFGRRRERECGSRAASAAGPSREPTHAHLHHRTDGITLCREAPASVNEGEIAVASKEEWHAARLSGRRLLALWNALPGIEKRRKVGDREALIDQLWSAIEALPDPDRQFDTKEPSKQVAVIAMLQRPRAQPSRKSLAPWASGPRSGAFSREP
jgi:hypothetical protein